MLRTLTRLFKAMSSPSPPPVSRPRPNTSVSPVAWVSDDVWSAWQYWGSDPVPSDFPTIEFPDLIPADAGDLERAPRAEIPPGAPVPPPGRVKELAQLLASTPPSVGVRHPVWPVCCSRLATLINHDGDGVELEKIESETGPLDRAFLAQDLRSNWDCRSDEQLADTMRRGYGESLEQLREGGVEGLVIFQCRSCGRVYVGGCHP